MEFTMNKKTLFLILVLMAIFLSGQVFAQNQVNQDTQYLGNLKNDVDALAKRVGVGEKNIDVTALKKLIIHESGRLKPFDSYARTMLLVFSGKSTFEGKSAVEWIAQVMWKPETTVDQRIFKITYDQVLVALGIRPDKGRRYSYNELVRGFEVLSQIVQVARNKDQDYLSASDKEFLRIYDNFVLYNQIMNSFLFSLPVQTFLVSSMEVKNALGLEPDINYFSYTDIMKVSDNLRSLVATINAKSQDQLVAKDVLILEISQKYDSFLADFEELPFRMFPTYSHGEKWFSAWEIFGVSKGNDVVKEEIADLDSTVRAYLDNDQAGFDRNFASFYKKVTAKVENSSVLTKVNAELFYNSLAPFYYAQIILVLIFIILAVSYLAWQKRMQKIAFWLFSACLVLVFVGIINRFLIVFRPPITNLFETFVFVAFISGLLGVVIERFHKNGLGTLGGTLSVLILLVISNTFVASGDTLDVLVAVLRSNFWLSTHVVTINLGYTGVFLSGVIGHIYLFQLLKKNHSAAKLKNSYRVIYAIQAFGLIFTLIGTVLGGIWADQSWGRFWGWDPKENGSLMIVLWSALLFHARFDGMIKDLGFAIGSILGIIVLMIAWFGINLLGVGLHSYGFVAGIAYTLYTYIALQIVFVVVMYGVIEYRNQKNNMIETEKPVIGKHTKETH